MQAPFSLAVSLIDKGQDSASIGVLFAYIRYIYHPLERPEVQR